MCVCALSCAAQALEAAAEAAAAHDVSAEQILKLERALTEEKATVASLRAETEDLLVLVAEQDVAFEELATARTNGTH